MVATAPSPTVEWPAAPEAAIAVEEAFRSRRARPKPSTGAGGLRTPMVRTGATLLADTSAGILAAVALGSLGRWTELAVGVLWAAVVWVTTRDLRRLAPRRVEEIARHVAAAGLVLVFLAVAAAGALGREVDPVRLLAFAILTSTVAFAHRGVSGAIDARHPSRTLRVVVAGNRRGVERMLAEVRDAGSPVTVVSVCLTGESQTSFGTPVSTGLDALRECVREHGADAVVVVPCRQVGPAQLRRLGWQLERDGTQLFVGPSLGDLGPGRARLRHAGPLPLIEVRHAPLHGGGPRLAKATWERLAAGLALVALAPLILVLALVIRLESNGPALFRQTRVGRDGVPFTMLKFRTMCVDAEDRRITLAAQQPRDGVLFKMRDDPRITKVGRLLRRYSLDEVPQLVNVLRGEMALVGPRPPLPCEVAQYEGDIHRRLAVTPGLTGLWQVSGRSDLSWEESVRLDLRYVENWSLGLDVAIVLRTVGAVLGHRGAY